MNDLLRPGRLVAGKDIVNHTEFTMKGFTL